MDFENGQIFYIDCEHTFVDGVCSICSSACEHNYVNHICTICLMVEEENRDMAGTFGMNLTWIIDDEGTLTISGTGAMYDTSPWSLNATLINKVVIKEGVSNIGRLALLNYAV